MYKYFKDEQSKEIEYRISTAFSYENYPIELCNNPDIKGKDAYQYCFGKSILHDKDGVLLKDQYKILLDAIFRDTSKFRQLKMGGEMKLVCPSCIYSYEIFGAPKWSHRIRDPPSITSKEGIQEMIELYWMSILRDIPFSQWNTHSLVQRAVSDLSKSDERVTIDTLFRGSSIGDLHGSYVSQFLLMTFRQGIAQINQKYQYDYPGINYLDNREEVIRILNGILPEKQSNPPLTRPRLISTLRDGASYVHVDEPVQAFENAIRILREMKVSTNPGNPYLSGLPNESSFVDYGVVDIFDLVHRVSRIAALACWFHKWTLLRLRPEEYSFLLQRREDNEISLSIHPDWDQSDIKKYLLEKKGNVLLSSTYPEGSPTHPSYPSGHAVFSGTACTVVKAFFSNNTTFKGIDGITYTVCQELDKLASNIASFRNAAGIHYRSDMEEGILLGEQVAINFLQEEIKRYKDAKYLITKRDGTTITIE